MWQSLKEFPEKSLKESQKEVLKETSEEDLKIIPDGFHIRTSGGIPGGIFKNYIDRNAF